METETLHWQPGSEQWHGDLETVESFEDFGPAYGEVLDDRFDRHPEEDASWPQKREQ